MSNDSICTVESQSLFNSTRGSTVCLTRNDSIGLTLVAESTFISLVAVLAVFVWIIRKAFKDRRLICKTTDIYMLCLFTFDIITALGGVVSVKWIHEGKVYSGSFCTTQGVLQQLGETGSALTTLALAVHTFVVVLWNHKHPPAYVAYIVVGLTWIFVAFFVAMGVSIHAQGPESYMAPVGYWCWISTRFQAEQYAGEYVWIWVTMLISLLTYTALFLWARGNLSISRTHWWKLKLQGSIATKQDIDPSKDIRWISIRMIVYPFVFIMTTLPLSVVRWSSGFGSNRRNLAAATFAVTSIYGLAGALNVLLFLFTRLDLLLPRNRWLAPGPISMQPLPQNGTTMGSGRPNGHIVPEPAPTALLPAADEELARNT